MAYTESQMYTGNYFASLLKNMRIHMCTHTHMYIYIYTIYIYIYVYIHTHIYVYMCAHGQGTSHYGDPEGYHGRKRGDPSLGKVVASYVLNAPGFRDGHTGLCPTMGDLIDTAVSVKPIPK